MVLHAARGHPHAEAAQRAALRLRGVGRPTPYRGVRGTAKAEILADRAPDMLPRLIERYLGDAPSPLADWLLSRLDREVAIRLHDLRVTSFDYTPRMS